MQIIVKLKIKKKKNINNVYKEKTVVVGKKHIRKNILPVWAIQNFPLHNDNYLHGPRFLLSVWREKEQFAPVTKGRSCWPVSPAQRGLQVLQEPRYLHICVYVFYGLFKKSQGSYLWGQNNARSGVLMAFPSRNWNTKIPWEHQISCYFGCINGSLRY